MRITCNKSNPPLGGVLAVEYFRFAKKVVELTWGEESTVTLPNAKKPVPYGTSNDLIRALENAFNKSAEPLQKVTLNHWLSFSLILDNEMPRSLEYLDKTLGPLTYLSGESLSVADLSVFSVLYVSSKYKDASKSNSFKNVARWMKLIEAQPPVAKALKEIPTGVLESLAKTSSRLSPQRTAAASSGRQQEGKFIELPHAEMGKVVVRFPPEASGFLHIGHAKAALLNQYYQQAFDGKLIMRFDDTNPAKENAEFEKVILEDVEMLEIKPDLFTHTSQYFDLMLQYCEKLIKESKAFVDDTPAEQMKSEREQKLESSNRNNSVEKNLQLWAEMQKASDIGVKCCVRAKIDMQSANGCLRDPTIYRCKPEVHPRTGTKYKVYPTYDFACPIVDSIEGVTHVLRTMEYHDRDPQFYWFIDAIGLRKPYIWEYSRLSMTNTVLSKRKLTWFVEQGLVDGWDDPRMPTVRGVLRRGMTVEGLRQFITAQGSSRSVVFMEWDKIWAINKKVIDPVAPRYTALQQEKMVPVSLDGVSDTTITAALHPKNPEIGTKTVHVSSQLLIEQTDAKQLKEGENATFVNYGNVMIDKIIRASDGSVTQVIATPNLDNKDYKKTVKLTWLMKSPKVPLVQVYCVYFDHIISKALLGKDEDFKKYIGHPTRWEVPMLGEPELANVKEGQVIQLQRCGFFRVDVAPAPPSPHTCKSTPLVLFHVPDGHTKELPGKEWIPQPAKEPSSTQNSSETTELNEKIAKQGLAVRALKAAKADKEAVNQAVKLLLELKAKFKDISGHDWTPETAAAVAAPPPSGESDAQRIADSKQLAQLQVQIAAQGDKIRKIKAAKAEKSVIDVEVKNLLNLKAQYKAITGADWVPSAAPPAAKPAAAQPKQEKKAASPPKVNGSGDKSAALGEQVSKQGDLVRELKTKKAEKASVDEAVKKLLELKAQYLAETGTAYAPPAPPRDNKAKDKPKEAKPKEAKEAKSKEAKEAKSKEAKPKDAKPKDAKPKEKKEAKVKEQSPKPAKDEAASGVKKVTRLGLEASKETDLPEWYSQVITKSEMIDYYDISGCYILRPWSYSIWDKIRTFLSNEFKKLGVKDGYFPIFVSKAVLEREKTHIADFAPEVAWVTHSGSSELAEHIAIRPTSETVMYPAYARWIQSHRDLPYKLNQWNNVVRWEFKQPQPFLRTREFLWQEGHTAFRFQEEAAEEVMQILELYAQVYEDLLAVPVIKGRKTEKEKFAGGDWTTTVEAYVPASGRGIQGATSHHLGQNFSKMFEVVYDDPDTHEKAYVYQNSWGLTTRTIGVMVLVHGDDRGLVLPPRIADVQAIVVPCGITVNSTADERKNLIDSCKALVDDLIASGIRAEGDYRDNYSPGWKFNHWELKGVPIRVELGPKDMAKGEVVAVRRLTGDKRTLRRAGAGAALLTLLEETHAQMLDKATKERDARLSSVTKWDDFTAALENKHIILAPFCGEIPCEDQIKNDSARTDDDPNIDMKAPAMGAKSLCIPFKQPRELTAEDRCIHPACKNKPKFITLFGRSY